MLVRGEVRRAERRRNGPQCRLKVRTRLHAPCPAIRAAGPRRQRNQPQSTATAALWAEGVRGCGACPVPPSGLEGRCGARPWPPHGRRLRCPLPNSRASEPTGIRGGRRTRRGLGAIFDAYAYGFLPAHVETYSARQVIDVHTAVARDRPEMDPKNLGARCSVRSGDLWRRTRRAPATIRPGHLAALAPFPPMPARTWMSSSKRPGRRRASSSMSRRFVAPCQRSLRPAPPTPAHAERNTTPSRPTED